MRRIVIGSKLAASRTIVGRRLADLGVETRPSPPRARRASPASAMTRSVGSSLRRTPSSVRSSSPGCRAADDDPALRQRRAVEDVQRASEGVHDVVRHVDDVRDRAHPGSRQPRTQPHRRRRDRDAGEDAADVARAAIEVLDAYVHLLRARDGRVLTGERLAARRRTAPPPRARGRRRRAGRRGSSSGSPRAPRP